MVRDVARHLQGGGAVVTFPAGRNEPDPDVYPDAGDALRVLDRQRERICSPCSGYARRTDLCSRRDLAAAARHPLARLRRNPEDQQLLASAFQLLCQVMFGTRPVTARVQIGRPLRIGEPGLEEPAALHRAVLQQMRELISVPPVGIGKSVL